MGHFEDCLSIQEGRRQVVAREVVASLLRRLSLNLRGDRRDKVTGVPTAAKLHELGVGWAIL